MNKKLLEIECPSVNSNLKKNLLNAHIEYALDYLTRKKYLHEKYWISFYMVEFHVKYPFLKKKGIIVVQ